MDVQPNDHLHVVGEALSATERKARRKANPMITNNVGSQANTCGKLTEATEDHLRRSSFVRSRLQ